MLTSQRALFDIPREVCFLNAASYSPLPRAAVEAGRIGAARKGQPWLIDNAFALAQYERARSAAAAIINADANDIALTPSISYGVATAAKNLKVPAGARVLVLQDDHSSPVLEWHQRAAAGGFTLDTVAKPSDHDWTAAVLAALERRGAPPLALVSISTVHWADGVALDMNRIVPAARKQGAAIFLDATQGAGVLPLDVRARDPDFVAFPTYKWLLGPYGRAFLYVAKRHQNGIPLEQTSYGRRAVRAEQDRYFTDTAYLGDARRFDMGERDHFISMEMASIGIELVTQWGADAIAARLSGLTTRLAQGFADLDLTFTDARHRAPHLFCIGFPSGMPKNLTERLAANQVYVAPRLGRLRVSPHVYNDEADIDRFIEVLRSLIRPRQGREALIA
jgi:selenocysteine lyase/cysteine desulfurase